MYKCFTVKEAQSGKKEEKKGETVLLSGLN